MLEDNCAALDQISNTRQVEGNALINEVINHFVRPKDRQTLSGLVNFYYVFNCWNFLYQTMAPNIYQYMSVSGVFIYLPFTKLHLPFAPQQKECTKRATTKANCCTCWKQMLTLFFDYLKFTQDFVNNIKNCGDSSVAVYSCQTALALRVRTLNVGTVRSAAVDRLTLSLQQKATKFCIQSERLN